LPHASLDMMNMNLIPSDSPKSRYSSESGSPELRTALSKEPEPFMDMLYSGWNPDLPDPPLLNHLYVLHLSHHFCLPLTPHFSIDVFFRCDPCGSRVLHRPSFLASMHLPPRDVGFPHSAILHAIVEFSFFSFTPYIEIPFSVVRVSLSLVVAKCYNFS
jgi:hypothetical protein